MDRHPMANAPSIDTSTVVTIYFSCVATIWRVSRHRHGLLGVVTEDCRPLSDRVVIVRRRDSSVRTTMVNLHPWPGAIIPMVGVVDPLSPPLRCRLNLAARAGVIPTSDGVGKKAAASNAGVNDGGGKQVWISGGKDALRFTLVNHKTVSPTASKIESGLCQLIHTVIIPPDDSPIT